MKFMEIPWSPEVEAKLNRFACETGRGTQQAVIEFVAGRLDHQEWFKQQVETGIASLHAESSLHTRKSADVWNDSSVRKWRYTGRPKLPRISPPFSGYTMQREVLRVLHGAQRWP